MKDLPKKPTARCFLVDDEKNIFFVKHGPEGNWTLPGGHVEENEDPYDAMKREIYEELGLDAKIIGPCNGIDNDIIEEYALPLAVYEITYEHIRFGMVRKQDYIFLAKTNSNDFTIQTDEIYDWRWFSINQVYKEEKMLPQVITILKNNENLILSS